MGEGASFDPAAERDPHEEPRQQLPDHHARRDRRLDLGTGRPHATAPLKHAKLDEEMAYHRALEEQSAHLVLARVFDALEPLRDQTARGAS